MEAENAGLQRLIEIGKKRTLGSAIRSIIHTIETAIPKEKEEKRGCNNNNNNNNVTFHPSSHPEETTAPQYKMLAPLSFTSHFLVSQRMVLTAHNPSITTAGATTELFFAHVFKAGSC